MKVIVRKGSLGAALTWAQRGLFAGAIALLGYCAYAVADAWIFQSLESAALERFVPNQAALPAVTPDGVIGRMEVARLGVSVMVVEGTNNKTLRRAVGHITGTALPGHPGNVGIAGHRDTYFRPLRNIQPNDIITLSTLRGEYRYRVESTKVVGPANVEVLNSTEGEILTLVTCYPFYYVGSAPERFIVRAARVT